MTDSFSNNSSLQRAHSESGAPIPETYQAPPSIDEGTDVEIADVVLSDLARRYGSRIISCDGQFYAYGGTHWRALATKELKSAIYGYDKAKLSKSAVVKLNTGRTGSILTIMGVRADEPEFFSGAPKGINCKSGFIEFDLSGMPCLTTHSPDHRQRHCLPGEWSPQTEWQEAKLLNTFLGGCFGADEDAQEKIALISDVCGIAALGCATKLPSPKAIVLLGTSAANGKSELLAMIKGLLPSDAVCAIPPSRFSDERMLVQLAGRKLNACAELGTSRAIAADVFKEVVTGDEVMAKDIYCPATFFRPVAQHIYATNSLPPFQGGFDPGVERRLLVLVFHRTIPEHERIAEIGTRIAHEEADALLAFAVEGATRVLQAGHFTQPKSSREALREWIHRADPVLAWKERRTAYAAKAETPVPHAYDDFVKWADEEGIEKAKLPSSNNFVLRLRAHEGRFGKRTHKDVRMIVGLFVKPEGEG